MSDIWTKYPDAELILGFTFALDPEESIAMSLEPEDTNAIDIGDNFTCDI